MATFTINIQSFTQLQSGVVVVNGCADTTGTNHRIYYSNTSSIENGTILYNELSLTTLFNGGGLTYIGTSSQTEGTIDLSSTPTTNYTFTINNSGVVSNTTSC